MKNFKSGTQINQGYYKSFEPNLINRKWELDNMELIYLLSSANREVGKLDMYSEYIPNIDLFISMHVLKEATQSSKIEGTETNIQEALLERDDIPVEKRDDWDEVQNYTKAINFAISKLAELPFSSRLIRQTHKILLQGVRGTHKLPGEFRQSQNWIGGATLNDARFVPPVHTNVMELMSDLEHFVHNTDYYFPELLKIALVHYQFETIHPFLDGNGRVGRLLITLYLVSTGLLKKPILYLSDFFEKHRTQYYDNLMIVREKNNLTQWFKFFLVGVIETAKNGITTFENILKLQKNIDTKIQGLGNRASNAQKILTFLYQRPLIDATKISEICEISSASAYKIIAEMEQLEILKKISSSKRGKTYIFENYLKLFR